MPAITIESDALPRPNETSGATRTHTPLRDIPQFINTVP